jgi:hypothetical protein
MAKRHFVVMAREPGVMKDGLQVGDKHVNFHGKSGKTITDPGLAEAIDQQHGLHGSGKDKGKVWVERDERTDNHMNYHPDGVHRYFFGPTRMFAEGWERIFGRQNESRNE